MPLSVSLSAIQKVTPTAWVGLDPIYVVTPPPAGSYATYVEFCASVTQSGGNLQPKSGLVKNDFSILAGAAPNAAAAPLFTFAPRTAGLYRMICGVPSAPSTPFPLAVTVKSGGQTGNATGTVPA